MMAEMRLIDAAPLIEYFSGGDAAKSLAESISDQRFVEALKKAPTIDAVPVVRCKDCKHWKHIDEYIPHMECNIFCGAHEHGYPTSADDYCSYGERKEQ